MCGIVGMVAKRKSGFFGPYNKIFADLLYIDGLRGDDGTGMFMVDTDGDVSGFKCGGPVQYVLWDPDYLALEKEINTSARIVVGHNRKATTGKINDANAHPFIVKDEFVLVHNGTLSNEKALKEKSDVDSESLAKYLYRETPKDIYSGEEWGKVFRDVYGAYALIWYDLRINKLFVVRNSQRPLWMAETDGAYLFASESQFISVATVRNNTKVDVWKQVPEKTLWIFDLEAESPIKYTEVAVVAAPFPVTPTTTVKQSKTKPTVCMGSAGTDLTTKDVSALHNKYRDNTISVDIEDLVETDASSLDYYFYGNSPDIKFKADIVGFLPSQQSTDIAAALYTEGKKVTIPCRVISVQMVGVGKKKCQINVIPIVKNEATLTQ